MKIGSYTALVLSIGLVACGSHGGDASQTKVTNGMEGRESAMPWVAWITSSGHDCTGTFVSKKLMVTAAHCIKNSTPGAVKYMAPTGRDASSVSWTKHPLWRDSGSGPIPADMVKYDLAVVVFPDNTVSTFASVSAPPSVGQNVWLAGFGASSWSGRIGDPASGQSYLRWGGNTVDERSGDLIIFSGVNATPGGAQYGNGRDAAGAVGDSGGPLFTDSSFKNLVGVASGAVPAAGSQLKDLYVDLSSSSARSFLRSQGVAVP